MALAIALGWPPYQQARLHRRRGSTTSARSRVPPALLPRRRRPTPAEQRHLRQHAGLGASLVADALDEEPAGWIRGHHERWRRPLGLPGRPLGLRHPRGRAAARHRRSLRDAGRPRRRARRPRRAAGGRSLRRHDAAPDAGVLLRAALAWLDDGADDGQVGVPPSSTPDRSSPTATRGRRGGRSKRRCTRPALQQGVLAPGR